MSRIQFFKLLIIPGIRKISPSVRKRQSTGAKIEKLQMSTLFDDAFKAAIIKILQQAITNSLKTYENIENISKEIEVIKNNQMDIIELQNTTKEVKNSLDRFNSRLEITG